MKPEASVMNHAGSGWMPSPAMSASFIGPFMSFPLAGLRIAYGEIGAVLRLPRGSRPGRSVPGLVLRDVDLVVAVALGVTP